MFDVAGAKFAASEGVYLPVITVAPGAAGTQEHLAKKGATVAVGTASHPVTTFPLTENSTAPAALAVPLIMTGPSSYTPLPPDIINVVAAGAACAAEPVTTAPDKASATTPIPEIIFFIYNSLCRFRGIVLT